MICNVKIEEAMEQLVSSIIEAEKEDRQRFADGKITFSKFVMKLREKEALLSKINEIWDNM